MEVLGRPWQWWGTAPFQSAHYVGSLNAFRAYRRPIHDLSRYLFRAGSYPYHCRLRTPIGTVDVELHSWHDMVTVHEVFCRLDYLAPSTVRTVVDIGSNIGVSALYFLSRNRDAFCYLAEPDPRNIARLRTNLAPYSARYALDDCAVSDSEGAVKFGIESTGRYGGIGLELDEAILVRCREINVFLDDVITETGTIDVLKVDTEGLEERTIKAIRPDLLQRIRVIYLESPKPIERYRPESLVQSRRLFVTRLTSRS